MTSIFLDQEKNKETIAAIETDCRDQLAEEIADVEQQVRANLEAKEGMESEIDEHGEEFFPPVALAIHELSCGALERDIKWLQYIRKVQTKYFPEDVEENPSVEVVTVDLNSLGLDLDEEAKAELGNLLNGLVASMEEDGDSD